MTSRPPNYTAVVPGQTATLTVTASGSGVAYQWYEGFSGNTANPIAGATSTTYTTPPITTEHTYWVRMTNSSCGAFADSGNIVVGPCSPPSITSQPQDVTIFPTQQADLSVSGSAWEGLQWFRGAAGDTSNPVTEIRSQGSYRTEPLSQTTQFWARLYARPCGTLDTRTVTVTVQNCTIPIITNHPPRDIFVVSGQSATITVGASGSSLAYQWYEGLSGNTTNPIPGATNATYTTPPITSEHYYWVRVTNSSCGAFSDTGHIFVRPCSPPSITTQPQDVTIFPTQQADLSFSGSAWEGIQWFRGAAGDTSNPVTDIRSQTSYRTEPLNQTTQFWARLYARPCGTLDTRTVTVTVQNCTIPIITNHPPRDMKVVSGQPATITVGATGPSLAYQWYEGFSGNTTNPIAGATSATYTTPPITSQKYYWVRVTNSSCGAFSDTGHVGVSPCSPPSITAQPQDVTIFAGQQADLSFTGSGWEGYQWFRGVAGDTSNPETAIGSSTTFRTPPLTQTTRFWVRVYARPCGTLDTRTVTVNVVTCTLPTITSQPGAPANVVDGQMVTLSVSASSPTTLTYQWYQGASGDTTRPIAGATGTTYTTPPLHGTTAYWVQVSNGCGPVNSITVVLVALGACTPPLIVEGLPQQIRVIANIQMTLSVTATGQSLRYQWYVGATGDYGRPINGETGPSLVLGPPIQAGKYWVEILSPCGSASAETTIAIMPARRRIVGH